MSKIVNKTLTHAMMIQEKRLAMISNNIANATTSGYKSVQVSLEVPKSETSETQPSFPDVPSMVSYADLLGSRLIESQASLDIAIEGDGFFVISAPEGTRYTRNGRFALDATKRLVTSSGHPVMGIDGEIIFEGQGITIEPEGSIYSNGQHVGRLKIVDFDETDHLQPVGLSLFKFTGEESGIIPAVNCTARQGFYEASNVNIAEEMTNLIQVLQGFKAYDKAKKMAGDVTKQVVDLIAK